jgi:hypothetical protein
MTELAIFVATIGIVCLTGVLLYMAKEIEKV